MNAAASSPYRARTTTHLQRDDLLRHNGQHLDVDAVELVEAHPRATGRQSLEELPHRQVIQTVAATHPHANPPNIIGID
jgi:hypothetical protein